MKLSARNAYRLFIRTAKGRSRGSFGMLFALFLDRVVRWAAPPNRPAKSARDGRWRKSDDDEGD